MVKMNDRYPTQADIAKIRDAYLKLKCKGIAFIDNLGYLETLSRRWSQKQIETIYINWDNVRLARNPLGQLKIEQQ